MKILFISYFFPPDKSVGGYRASSIAQIFPQEDIEIVLLTANQELSKRDDLKEQHKLTHIYSPKGSQIRRIGYKTKILVGLEILKLDKFLFFPDLYFPWIKRALKVGKEIVNQHDIDAIMVTSPPYSSAVVGYRLAKKFNLPLIFDQRDPWALNPSLELPKFIVKQRHRKLERKITNYAKINVTVGNGYAQLHSESTGIKKKNFHVIPNGFFESNIPDEDVEKISKKFTVSFFGNYFKIHKPFFEEFAKGLKEMIEKNNLTPENFAVRYAGITSRKAILRDLAKGDLVPFFEDLGYLEGKKIIEEVQRSHLNFVLVPDSLEYLLATKIFDYALGNSHFLIIGGEGEISYWCKKIEQNYTLVEGKAESIAVVLNELYQKWRRYNLEYGCNTQKLAEYGRFKLAKKYANLVKTELEK